MILLPILAMLVGAIIAWFVVDIPIRDPIVALYMAVACLAGLDTVLGGVRSGLEGKFHTDVFVTGFVSNIVIAFFLAWLGDKIGVNLSLAVALVLGARIFTNLSLIRRFLLTKWQDARERKRLHKELVQPTVQSQIQVDTAP